MVVKILCVYKVGDKQVFADLEKDGVLIKHKPVEEIIKFVRVNNAKCLNFIIVNDSYFRGKDCSLKIMEEKDYVKIAMGNRKQKECNRRGFTGSEKGTSSEGVKRNIRQEAGRGRSIECSEKSSNRCSEVQNDVGNGLLVDSNGISILPECSPKQFHNDFSKEHEKMEFSPCVDTHSVDDLSKMHCFGHKNLGFVAIEQNGNICSVLKSSKNKKPGFTKDIMINALKHGGDRLDCFAINNGGLAEFYIKCGFIPVCRMKFNKEYAPEGWKSEWGEPDVVFMMHNLDTSDEVIKNYGNYGSYSDYTDSIPYFDDYDEALHYRDKLLEERKKKKYSRTLRGSLNVLKKALSDIK